MVQPTPNGTKLTGRSAGALRKDRDHSVRYVRLRKL